VTYRISTVSRRTGISRNTLLAWERRYGVPAPKRDPNGYRSYSETDIDLLLRIQGHLERGHQISEAIALVQEEGAIGITPPARDEETLAALREALGAHLLAFDRPGAEKVRQRMLLLPFRLCIEEIYLPLLREVGDRWHAGEVTVAQEHFTSAYCREQLIAILHSLGAGRQGSRHAVCAGFPGEQHELGLLAVAVKLVLHGWRVSYLGADLPAEELAEVVGDADLLCQSIVRRVEDGELTAYAHDLRTRLPARTAIALGGPGVGDLDGTVEGVWVSQDLDAVLKRLEG
jgi:DNA-binding transcriptional MerR regulator